MAKCDPTEIPQPATRPLRVYAFDPSHGRLLGNEMEIDLQYRDLAPGPVDVSHAHDAIAVIDYDASTKRYYKPIDLNDPRVLIRNGLSPSESDPRFHQQMVYAVASQTVEHFEKALGRRIHWRRAERKSKDRKGWRDQDILTLNLYPHAMQQANAFYSPAAHGILFGYFRADRTDPGRNLPGQTVFTCLSHDIVVHETTHAVVDGLRGYFLEQTNIDVSAFHEAFADLAALFRHFTHQEVVLDTLQRTGGQLYREELAPDAPRGDRAPAAKPQSDDSSIGAGIQITAQLSARNPLIELATQFGEASGMHRGLRSALGTPPTPAAIRSLTEPHARGSILVAAVFDAFLSVYLRRTANLFRIFRAGGGGANPEDLPGPLAQLLFAEVERTAEQFFVSCVRALDYCPPVDVTFGDFLRAVLTSEMDYDLSDSEGIRDAWMQAFRLRGILPTGADFFSEDALCWPSGESLGLPTSARLSFGSPSGLSAKEKGQVSRILQDYIADVLKRKDVDHQGLGLDPKMPFEIPSFHPVARRNRNGSVRMDMVVEVVQTAVAHFDSPDQGLDAVPFRGGATLIFSTHGTSGGGSGDAFVRYVVAKHIQGDRGQARRARQEAHLRMTGLADAQGTDRMRINFEQIHRGY